MASKPKNWPEGLTYLTSPVHSKALTAAQLHTLRTKPSPSPSSSLSPSNSAITIIASSATPTPCSTARIRPITDPAHPACGQHGLFATANLRPGAFILAYLGRVHGGSAADTAPDSDYDLWLDKGADVAVDAAREGNEARFVNDYRGVAERANACFGTAYCERWGQLCVGVWVVGGRKDGKDRGVRKGEEIVVSYGKGFWGKRAAESGGGGETGGGDG